MKAVKSNFINKDLVYHRIYLVIKIIFDKILSFLALIILLPMFILIAILIKWDSAGSVFFIHERIGLKGKVFKLYKFRTMYTNANAYSQKPSNDSRLITPLGHFLRRTTLDELPQFLNVLKGDMSLVGPRPEMPFIVDDYTALQKKRHNVRPGLTGLWQIHRLDDNPIHDNIKYDLTYIKNQSLSMDFWLIWKTIVMFFKNPHNMRRR